MGSIGDIFVDKKLMPRNCRTNPPAILLDFINHYLGQLSCSYRFKIISIINTNQNLHTPSDQNLTASAIGFYYKIELYKSC